MSHDSDPRLKQVEAAVRQRVGFDPQTIGGESLDRALRRRMTESGVDDRDRYVKRLLHDEAEFGEFLDQLLVPETWFFRDRQPFHCLRRFVTTRRQTARLGECLRVLSIPCSTGEEPYSIAMTLFDLGLLSSQFTIDGADLSQRVLDRAREGVYGKASLRGDEQEFPGLCERYLREQDDGYVVDDQLRRG